MVHYGDERVPYLLSSIVVVMPVNFSDDVGDLPRADRPFPKGALIYEGLGVVA
jgi:hypothetical protein